MARYGTACGINDLHGDEAKQSKGRGNGAYEKERETKRQREREKERERKRERKDIKRSFIIYILYGHDKQS